MDVMPHSTVLDSELASGGRPKEPPKAFHQQLATLNYEALIVLDSPKCTVVRNAVPLDVFWSASGKPFIQWPTSFSGILGADYQREIAVIVAKVPKLLARTTTERILGEDMVNLIVNRSPVSLIVKQRQPQEAFVIRVFEAQHAFYRFLGCSGKPVRSPDGLIQIPKRKLSGRLAVDLEHLPELRQERI